MSHHIGQVETEGEPEPGASNERLGGWSDSESGEEEEEDPSISRTIMEVLESPGDVNERASKVIETVARAAYGGNPSRKRVVCRSFTDVIHSVLRDHERQEVLVQAYIKSKSAALQHTGSTEEHVDLESFINTPSLYQGWSNKSGGRRDK